MGSLRFPFSLPNPPIPPKGPSFPQSAAVAVCVGAGVGIAAAVSLSLEWSAGAPECQRRKPWSSAASPIWASLCLADGSSPAVCVEPITGVAFPTVLCGRRRLLGAGVQMRKKIPNILWLKLGKLPQRENISNAFGKPLPSSVKPLRPVRGSICEYIVKEEFWSYIFFFLDGLGWPSGPTLTGRGIHCLYMRTYSFYPCQTWSFALHFRHLQRSWPMGSLRFLFSLPQPPKPPHCSKATARFHLAAVAAAAFSAGVGLAVAISHDSAVDLSEARRSPWIRRASPLWASISFAEGPTDTSVEPSTGASFPSALDGGRRLTGIGLRKASILGLKSISVYAFGAYADVNDLKRLGQKYGKLSHSELMKNEEFIADILDQDLCLTVRLQIVYNKLSISSMRKVFANTVGSRIQKFSGSNKELLGSFTSLFKDEYKLPQGSVIDLSREQGYVLQVKIDGKDVGKVQSKLLCKSVLDLYIGEDPFDKQAKEKIQASLASLLLERSD